MNSLPQDEIDFAADRLWYLEPAARFEEALPLGNGRLGAMIHGRPWRREDYYSERIPLNEESIWHGGPTQRENPDALKTLPEVRRLLLQGRVAEAEYLADLGLAAAPRNGSPYQAAGELVFTARQDHEPIERFRRELDLATAMATVDYRVGGTRFHREHFVSAPADVFVTRLSCDGPGRLNFHAYLRRRPLDGVFFREGRDIVGFLAEAGPGGVRFAVAMAFRCGGGQGERLGQCLTFDEAEEAVLYVAAFSSFRTEDPRAACVEALRHAAGRDFEELKREHIAEHRRLYGRVALSLGPGSEWPTSSRLTRLRQGGHDPSLHALHFQYGRYLTIAASRPGCLPTNLQGLWCDSMTPIWNCNYTVNVNLQMAYWPAEAAALPECHEPLLDFLKRLVERGRRTAREMYGCRGFVVHHTSDLWADTAPTGGIYASALWPLGGAWLALHAWEHYLFGGSEAFLEATGYPVLREAALFFCDYLVFNKRGERVVAPSVSPENWYEHPGGVKAKLCAGAAMDDQILRELFAAAARAAEILGVDEELRVEWDGLRRELPPTRIDRHGAIQEWQDGFEERDPGHRHLSHLFALHPGSQIGPLGEPDLAAAAAETLRRRLWHETDRTGWSLAWMANHFARLYDGDSALACLRRVLQEFTHPSLLSDCPPLNLDANFGCASAVVEMLLQSHRGEIHLLPALPASWPEGEVSGLRARGGFSVACRWRAGRLVLARITSEVAASCRLRTNVPLQPRPGLAMAGREGSFCLYDLSLSAGNECVMRAEDVSREAILAQV